MSTPAPQRVDVAVVGLGYIGLVLAAAAARAGLRVVGVERNPVARAAVQSGHPVFYEPGLEELLAELPPGALDVRDGLNGVRADTVVLCVGTAYEHVNGVPDLSDLRAALDVALDAVDADTLLIVRSTVPVGTCRADILPRLAEVSATPLLAYCPERTIQGLALAEIASLPQIVGGLDDNSVRLAADFFGKVTGTTVPVSSLETAELVKLVCNSHTDILYGFGNEVAFIADALEVNGREVIEAAGHGYPRPPIARPGYVGGSCLVKDPYLLQASSAAAGYQPSLILAARTVNERLPRYVADQVLAGLARHGIPAAQAKVLVCGIAYKGRPETDDVRGAASTLVARELAGHVGTLLGHDPVVPAPAVAAAGFEPVDLDAGLDGAHALVVLTDHPAYRRLAAADVLGRLHQPALVVDVWGLLADPAARLPEVGYRGFGCG
jgi:UDP-N-acetyl-D-mannosaminuronic acid dehydrogenase